MVTHKIKKWLAKGLPTGAKTPHKMDGKGALTFATARHNSLVLYPVESVKLGKMSFWGF